MMDGVKNVASQSPDAVFMTRALALARRAWGRTHPNPMVGALVVAADGTVVGEGWHEKAGGPHAEVHALRSAGQRARGATLYVTLEPCSTFGRTPPCTQAILAAGIRRVVAGATDPNPQHAGRGFTLLREAGVEVESGVCEAECTDLNLIFNHQIATGRPLFAVKVATTLCGAIAARSGDSKWITGPGAREDAHRWRQLFPAIAVGSGTVLSDDPRLSIRLPGEEEKCPRRYVFDRSLRTLHPGWKTAGGVRGLGAPHVAENPNEPLPAIYSDAFRANTTLVTTDAAPAAALERLGGTGVAILRLPAGEGFWPAFTAHCTAEGVTGVLFEGGSRLIAELVREKLADYLFAYRAPVILGDPDARPAFTGRDAPAMADALRLKNVRHATFGDDELMRGSLR